MSDPYRMTLDLNVLNHLGLNLYSNVAAVLSEAVANAWDADATEVRVQFATGQIQITDDGCGMSVADANDRFLKVGYNKRSTEGEKSPGGRSLMGRKGIGKLSLFSVADSVEIYSSKNGSSHGFNLDVPNIKKAINIGQDYHPPKVDSIPTMPAHGTMILLRNLNRRANANTINALKKRLARRFSIIGKGFKVFVDGEEVGIGDRDDLRKVQFLWEFGKDERVKQSDALGMIKRRQMSDMIDVDGRSYQVQGWIGSAAMPRHLDTVDGGNLNSIVVLAHGRLIQENILDRVNEGGIYTKYLTGQIEADFLDLASAPDIATSDRQRIIEDDPRYLALVSFVRATLNKIERDWTDWRNELGTEQAQERYPKLKEWIEALPDSSKRNAKRVIGTIEGLPIEDEAQRQVLLRQGVIAFERLRLKENTEKLAEALSTRAEQLLPLLGDHDQLEAAVYLDIIRGRVNVIRQFVNMVDDNEREKVLQQYLFDHLWLLDPSWERATGTERMEQRVHKEFEGVDADLDDEERAGRLDIKYRTAAGKHLIIELKRASVVASIFDLVKQGNKYKEATTKCLAEVGRGSEPVEVIFVLGRPVKETNPETVKRQLDSIGSRVVTYESLIQGALASYGEFLAARKSLDALSELFVPQPV